MLKKVLVGLAVLAAMAAAAARAQNAAVTATGDSPQYGSGQATSLPNGAVAGRAPIAPVAAYVVQPGDTVDVLFRFTPEFNDEVVVQPDGHATLKSTGDIQIAGMTLPEIMRAVAAASAAKLVDPEVTVSLKDFERPHFVVAGEVQLPGRFELRHATTTLQAILLAGGPKEDAAMRHVYLFRRLSSETSEVHELQLSRFDGRTRAKNDLILQPDDMILVRRDGLAKIGRFVRTFNLGVYLNPIPTTFTY